MSTRSVYEVETFLNGMLAYISSLGGMAVKFSDNRQKVIPTGFVQLIG